MRLYDKLRREARIAAAYQGHSIGWFLKDKSQIVNDAIRLSPMSKHMTKHLSLVRKVDSLAVCIECGATAWIQVSDKRFGGEAVKDKCPAIDF